MCPCPAPSANAITSANTTGLASSGAWGCFDEFNRLIPEVLSVCSLQFKAVTDGLKAHAVASCGRDRFDLPEPSIVIEDDRVTLDTACGVFITMNPGYLGRSELPEGLKVLLFSPTQDELLKLDVSSLTRVTKAHYTLSISTPLAFRLRHSI